LRSRVLVMLLARDKPLFRRRVSLTTIQLASELSPRHGLKEFLADGLPRG